jgi:hypothetical protein
MGLFLETTMGLYLVVGFISVIGGAVKSNMGLS